MKKHLPPLSENATSEPAADDTNAAKATYDPASTAHPWAAATAAIRTAASAELSVAATASNPPSTANGPLPASRPTKTSQLNQATSYADSVKKKLFFSAQQPVKKKSYQMKEDDLWSKLFIV